MNTNTKGVVPSNWDDVRRREETIPMPSLDDYVLGREPAGWSEIASWRQPALQRLIRKRVCMTAIERDARSARIASARR